MKNRELMLGSIAAGAILLSAVFAMPTIMAQPAQSQSGKLDENDERPSVQLKLNRKYHEYTGGVFKVRAGAGSHVAPLTLFTPNDAEIKKGETVMFYNPTKVSEPHTVTFVMDNNTFADFAAPFVVDNQTAITPAIPNANADPIIAPGPQGKNVIVALNNRSFMPTVVDSTGKAQYLPPNANYTVTGTEKYINSGWMWPKGMSPPGLPPIDSFSLTFENEGTYNYICVVHPWMSGSVVVK
jgi:plastocyanin